MSSFENMWEELMAALPSGRPGRMERGVHPEAAADLRLAVENPGRVRSLALTVPSAAVRELEGVPEAAGLRSTLLTGGGSEATLEIALEDPASDDLFAILADDVAIHVARADDAEGAVETWVGRIRRWQKFLRRAPSGLTAERQRGLYSELWFLREVLVPTAGAVLSVAAWTGPDGTVHDFQTDTAHVEVKSSVAGQPQIARINGERQLDDTGTPGLFLTHLSLSVARGYGETLAQMVSSVRRRVADGPAQGQLEDRLLGAGYHDMHERRYRSTGYTLRDRSTFRVVEGFPRIVESDLREGVGAVHYRIAIAACTDFLRGEDDLASVLGRKHGG